MKWSKICLLWLSHLPQIVKFILFHVFFFFSKITYIWLSSLKKLSKNHRCLFSESKILHIAIWTGQRFSFLKKNETGACEDGKRMASDSWNNFLRNQCQVLGVDLPSKTRHLKKRNPASQGLRVSWAPWLVSNPDVFTSSYVHLAKQFWETVFPF